MNWYIGALKKYAVFQGRARCKEYWMFVLVNCIISTAFSIIINIVNGKFSFTIGWMFYVFIDENANFFANLLSGIFSVYSLTIICPSFALAVRRLHDIGRPGKHILFGLIPLVGIILLLIWAAKEGVAGDNQYGPDPKA